MVDQMLHVHRNGIAGTNTTGYLPIQPDSADSPELGTSILDVDGFPCKLDMLHKTEFQQV